MRNIANIVPMYRETEEYVATTSCIEYAINILQVKNIIVCGHSNCGGCNALLKTEDELHHLPHTRKWLELAARVKEKVEAEQITSQEEREWRTEQLNIIEQMEHLLTYPYIAERYKAQAVQIYGWYYVIETGEVFNYDHKAGVFKKIE